MVYNVGFGNGYGYNPQQYDKAVGFNGGLNPQFASKDIENVVKYATGTAIVNEEAGGPFEGMGLMLGISGATSAFAGGKWLLKNKADLSGAWAKYKTEALAQNAELKAAGGLTSKGGIKHILNNQSAKTLIDAVPTGDKLAKLDAATQAKYNQVKTLAEMAKHDANAKGLLKSANQKLAEANALAHADRAAAPAKGFFGKIGRFLGKVTGFSKLNGAVKNFATKSPLTAKMLKFGKGNGIFLGITAAVELFTQVIPTFAQLGPVKGVKQLIKSTVKTAASVGGWIAGSALGTQGGAMLGAAIGSVVPGVGTVIGGVIGGLCGFVGGCVGSWLATKAADKVCGKSELDIAKEKQAKELADKAKNDPKAVQELMTVAAQRLQAEGDKTEDAKIAFGSLNRLRKAIPDQQQVAGAAPQTATAQTPAQTSGQPTAPSFQGQSAQYTANPFAAGIGRPNFDQASMMDQDFMAMSAGLV